MRAYERLLEYVKVWTTSDESGKTTPSAPREFDLAEKLVREMKDLGIKDARVDEHCYVYGSIPASPGYEDAPSIGFISHLDTAPDFSGKDVKPQLWPDYDGGDVTLPSGRVLSPKMFPDLAGLKGKTLITSDGSTLLGADDKAGIAEIMTMAEELLRSDAESGASSDSSAATGASSAQESSEQESGTGTGFSHGRVAIAFTPDEEIGSGAEDLDLPAFGAKYAYTVDGGAANVLEYENFNAAAAVFEITGVSVHPGDAKDTMINASLVAMEIGNALPSLETPSRTEGYEGFYHVTGISGNVEKAEISMIIRDHSRELYNAKLETLKHIEKVLNEKYGAGTVALTIKEQYRNMLEKIRPHMHLIKNAEAAVREAGLQPETLPVRGGTDGAQLSFRGLPCPNLGTGGYGFHGPYEHIAAEDMDDVVKILLGIVKRYAKG